MAVCCQRQQWRLKSQHLSTNLSILSFVFELPNISRFLKWNFLHQFGLSSYLSMQLKGGTLTENDQIRIIVFQ